MTDNIPEWDPATFKPTHTTIYGHPVQAVDTSCRDHVNVRFFSGIIADRLLSDLTPIPEPVTAREQWGILRSHRFYSSDSRADAWGDVQPDPEAGEVRTLAQLKAIDGRLVLCDGDGNPVQVAQ